MQLLNFYRFFGGTVQNKTICNSIDLHFLLSTTSKYLQVCVKIIDQKIIDNNGDKDRAENNHWTITDYNRLVTKLINSTWTHIQKKLISGIIIFCCSEYAAAISLPENPSPTMPNVNLRHIRLPGLNPTTFLFCLTKKINGVRLSWT